MKKTEIEIKNRILQLINESIYIFTKYDSVSNKVLFYSIKNLDIHEDGTIHGYSAHKEKTTLLTDISLFNDTAKRKKHLDDTLKERVIEGLWE